MQTITAVASVLAALTLSGTAQAQTADLEPIRPYSIKAGLYFPFDSDAKDPGGNSLFAIGAEYTFSEQVSHDRRTSSQVGISYIGGDDLTMIPITISQVIQPLEGNRNGPYYVGGGFGLYIVSIDRPYEEGRDKTLFGGYGVAGLNISEALYAEAKYHIVSRYNSRRLDGLQISIGGRF